MGRTFVLKYKFWVILERNLLFQFKIFVPFFNFFRYFCAFMFIIFKTLAFKTGLALCHFRNCQKLNQEYLLSKHPLEFKILHLVHEAHGNTLIHFSRYPWMVQTVVSIISVWSLDCSKPLKKALSDFGERRIRIYFLYWLQFWFEWLVCIDPFNINWMLSACQNHVHDNSNRPHIDTFSVLLAASHLRSHKCQCPTIFVIRLQWVLVLLSQTKVY